MDLEFDARYDAFREQVRKFLAENKPPKSWGLSDGKSEERAAWLGLQIDHGYWARTIPKEYGGHGAEPDLLETVIMDEEFNKAGVVRGTNAQGPSMLVPTLLTHGSEAQRKRWIGPTLRGETIWCQGYSEPDSGSDLASLQTKAVEDGDYILMPMDTPGIEIQPLQTMSGSIGENSFNQVFLSDVRVPKANVVGQRGEGWKIANTTLKHERNSLNANVEGTWMRLSRLMSKETVNGVPLMASPVYRDRLMKLHARALSMKHHGMRLLTSNIKGENPGVAGLIVKLQNCQLSFDMAALALDVMGELGALYDHSKYERERGYWQAYSFFSLGLIIGGGTAQIQKNIIAERGLGLPREPKPARA